MRRWLLVLAAMIFPAAALAEGSSAGHGKGGWFVDFGPIVRQYNASGERFRIQGHCQSACTLFLSINFQTGFWTIVIAHVTFNISYVVTTVRARLVGFDRHLEEAAMDLYANGVTTFWRVTLPLIAPGVLAALLLSFALSIDDFVITSFNAGTTVTFPLFVWGAARVGVPPQVNVVGAIIFLATIALMFANVLRQRRRPGGA